jgi:hypothetical protein
VNGLLAVLRHAAAASRQLASTSPVDPANYLPVTPGFSSAVHAST